MSIGNMWRSNYDTVDSKILELDTTLGGNNIKVNIHVDIEHAYHEPHTLSDRTSNDGTIISRL